MISDRLSKKLQALVFIATLLIVLLHTRTLLEINGKWTYYLETFISILCSTAVPFFFMISGFLIGNTAFYTKPPWFKKTLIKRLKTLGIPLFLWCTLYIIVTFPIGFTTNIINGRPLTEDFAIQGMSYLGGFLICYGLNPFSTCSALALWYVRTLLIFVILSPLYTWIIPKQKIYGLLICISFFFVWSFTYLLPEGGAGLFYLGWLDARALFAFPLGLYFSRYPFSPKHSSLFCLSSIFLFLVTFISYSLCTSPILFKLSICLLIAIIWFAYDLIPFTASNHRIYNILCKWFYPYTFFVYAVHLGIYYYLWCQPVKSFFFTYISSNTIIFGYTRFSSVLFASFIVAWTYKKLFPKSYALLTGGR